MCRFKRGLALATPVLVFGVFCSYVFAMSGALSDIPDEVEADVFDTLASSVLRGLEGVDVGVQLSLDFDKRHIPGLSAGQLRTDTELKLRLAGIKVFSQRRLPGVSVAVDVLDAGGGAYIYLVRVALVERVRLIRAPLIYTKRAHGQQGCMGERVSRKQSEML